MSGTAAFFQLLINGVFLGSMYGVAAIGLSLIFGSMEITFIAQGSVMILVAYCTFFLFQFGNIDPFVSLSLVLPGFMILGFAFYHLLFKRVAGMVKNAPLLIAFGFATASDRWISLTPGPKNWVSDTTKIPTNTRHQQVRCMACAGFSSRPSK